MFTGKEDDIQGLVKTKIRKDFGMVKFAKLSRATVIQLVKLTTSKAPTEPLFKLQTCKNQFTTMFLVIIRPLMICGIAKNVEINFNQEVLSINASIMAQTAPIT